MIGVVRCSLRLLVFAGFAVAAFAASHPTQARVGVTSQTTNNPLGTPPQQQQRTLRVGIDVFASERIQTAADDRAHLLFLDGSSLTVGPNADLVIDRFIFDPQSGTGELSVNAAKGVFRLVGGKITKNGSAAITVGTTTVGIRGGIAIISAPEGQPLQAYFMFGKDMTVSTPDGSQTAIRPGSLITVAPGQLPTPPVMAPPNSLAGPIAQLEAPGGESTQTSAPTGTGSTTGTSTGAAGTSTQVEQQVVSSGVPGINSNYDPSQVAPPDANFATASTGGSAATADQTTGAGGATQSTPDPIQALPPPPPPPPPTITISAEGRYVRIPALINVNTSTLFADPDPVNNVVLSSATVTGNSLTVVASSGPQFTVPWQPTGSVFAITEQNSVSSIGPVTGSGFVSPEEDFYRYSLLETSNSNNPVGFFGGVPTPGSGLPTVGFGAREVIPLQGTVPFLPDPLSGNPLFAGVTPGLMLIAYSPRIDFTVPGGDDRSMWMQATLNIEGQGAAQSSFLTIATGTFFLDESNNFSPTMGGRAQTIARFAANGRTTRYFQWVGAAETENGSAIYGPNAEYMVFHSDNINNTGGTTIRETAATWSQTHGSSGSSSLDSTAFGPTDLPSNIGVTRTGETLVGYAGSLVEVRDASAGNTFVTKALRNFDPSDVWITKDPATNRAAGSFYLANVDNAADNMTLNWGSLTGANSSTSAFIDDKNFTMHNSPSGSQYNSGANPLNARIDMVTQASVPDSDWLPSGVSFCTCAYLTWGYWQGEMIYQAGPDINDWSRVSLGTWVMGNISNDVDLPISGTATYNGHIIGNVENGVNRYVAAGNFSNAWNFGTRTGNLAITNFDGANYVGTTAGSPGNVNFSGSFSGAGRTGALNGSFFRSPTDAAAYQAGSFNIDGPGYRAAGTFAAQR